MCTHADTPRHNAGLTDFLQAIVSAGRWWHPGGNHQVAQAESADVLFLLFLLLSSFLFLSLSPLFSHVPLIPHIHYLVCIFGSHGSICSLAHLFSPSLSPSCTQASLPVQPLRSSLNSLLFSEPGHLGLQQKQRKTRHKHSTP